MSKRNVAECGVTHGDSDLRFHGGRDVTLAGNDMRFHMKLRQLLGSLQIVRLKDT
jgi:hypothetical protein